MKQIKNKKQFMIIKWKLCKCYLNNQQKLRRIGEKKCDDWVCEHFHYIFSNISQVMNVIIVYGSVTYQIFLNRTGDYKFYKKSERI